MTCKYCSMVHPDHQPWRKCQECIDTSRTTYRRAIKTLGKKHGVDLSEIDIENLLLEEIKKINEEKQNGLQ